MNREVSNIISKLELNLIKFSQSDVIRLIENPFCEVWTNVYSFPCKVNNSASIFSCFAHPEIENQVLDGQDWLKHPEDFSPGFSMRGNETTYFSGQDDGFEPIILKQYFHVYNEGQLLLNQEFILLLELYRDEDGDYYSVGHSGEKEKAVEFVQNCVKIKT
jgi:hypothetical protein